jgi:hypothetical protein
MKAIITLAIVLFFSFISISATAQTVNLGGKVWWDFNDNGVQDNGEIPTQWIGVTLYFDNDDNGVSDAGTTPITISTDVNGEYMFTDLAPGKYYVRADVGYSHYKTTVYGGDPDNNIIGDNNGFSQSVSSFKIKSETIDLQPGTEPDGTGATNTNTNKTLDFGTWKANGLGDLVWADNNANGMQDSGEPGIGNVTVILKNTSGATLATTTTDAQGKYYFYDPMGYYGTNDYELEFVTPAGYVATSSNAGDDTKDSDIIGGKISGINVPQGSWDHTFDAGFKPISLLPLNLLSFTASLKTDKVDLKWITTNEVSVSYIVLEKSTDGKNFNDIATILPNNNGAEKNYYQYSDNINTKVEGIYFYRLRTVNNNGSASLSEVKSIRISNAPTTETLSIVTYPNPVVNEVNITIPTSWQNKKIVYSIYSVNGALVKQITVSNSNKTFTQQIANLPVGIYVVSVQNEGNVLTQRIVKQ